MQSQKLPGSWRSLSCRNLASRGALSAAESVRFCGTQNNASRCPRCRVDRSGLLYPRFHTFAPALVRFCGQTPGRELSLTLRLSSWSRARGCASIGSSRTCRPIWRGPHGPVAASHLPCRGSAQKALQGTSWRDAC